ncbi:hypothetical protein FKP32DRAFT_1641905 [Trametes sanguinea]|nr:hypothetical protein FKP32DRAFT_1641905 [Trametes sanguinea]
MESLDRELELRAHIHSLLSQYALAHLATDHLLWTEDVVTEALSKCLHTIPATDSTAVALPIDPFELLNRRWGIANLDPYEEIWKVSGMQVVQYLKQHLSNKPGQASIADRQWEDNEDEDDVCEALALVRPMSPILTARARRETPALGKGKHGAKIPQSNKQISQILPIAKVNDGVPNEPEVTMADALALKLHIDTETHREVTTLIKAVPTLAKSSQITPSRFVEEFLRAETPPPDFPELEPLPVFSRRDRLGRDADKGLPIPGGADPSLIPATMSHLVTSVLSSVPMQDEEEEDMAEEHLVIVNGWQSYRSSSPLSAGTPSLGGSSSAVDELFMPSSPHPELFDAEELFMEDYLMPRSERIGGIVAKKSLPPQDKLSDYLSALKRPPSNHSPRILRSPKSQPSSPRTTISSSVLGHPPSILPDIIPQLNDASGPNSDDTITYAVRTVELACGNLLGSEDLAHLILSEKLDEKDGLLMDVPALRPPNDHATRDLFLPTQLTDLLAPVKCSSRRAKANVAIPLERKPAIASLKKAKGLQPLQIELSWIPFKYGRTVPTDEEVADVQNDPCPQLVKGIDMAQDEIVLQLTAFLDDSMAFKFGSQPVQLDELPSAVAWLGEDEDKEDPELPCRDFEEDQALVLTRRDRRRLAGLPMPSQVSDCDDAEDGALSSAHEEPAPKEEVIEDAQDENNRPTKRVRFSEAVQVDSLTGSSCWPLSDSTEAWTVDDSGVFLEDIDRMDSGQSRPAFAQLAYGAEGFDEPDTHCDIFPDVHAVHFGDYYYFDHELDPSVLGFPIYQQPGSPLLSSPSPDCVSPTGPGTLEAAGPLESGSPAHDGRSLFSSVLSGNTAVQDLGTPGMTSGEPSHQQAINLGPAPLQNTEDRVLGVVTKPLTLSARASLSQFLALCGKADRAHPDDLFLPSSPTHGVSISELPETVKQATSPAAHRTTEVPLQLIDDRTWLLPQNRIPPNALHTYMASVELIQKRALTRFLSAHCAAELIERESLGPCPDLQLILDCDTAVIFAPVESLPGRGDALTASLAELSWRFSSLLVLFQCYPSAWSYRSDKDFADKATANVWSPPVVNAVRKLRRNLGIAEGTQAKRVATTIEYAFATSVEATAAFVRMYGDAAANRAPAATQVLWEDRTWLAHEERDGEYDLAGVSGMNLFAASLLLSHTTLEDFLEMDADRRLMDYGQLVGVERIAQFNAEMTRRIEAMQLPPSSPINGDASSSSNTIPYVEDSDLGYIQ